MRNVKKSEAEQRGDAQGKPHKRGQHNEEQRLKKLRRDGVIPCGRYMLQHQFAIMTVERWTLSAER